MGRWGWAIAAGALACGALMWLIAVGGARGGGGADLRAVSREAIGDEAASAKPVLDAQPEALAARSERETPVQPVSLLERAPAVVATPPPWPSSFETIRVTGRVVDSDGAPLAGAEVQLIPDEFTRNHLAGDSELRAHVDADRVHSEAAGRFELHGPWKRGTGFRTSYEDAFPVARVRAAGYVTFDFACVGFAGGEHDLGDVVLAQRAAGLRLQVVDIAGRPVVGAMLRGRHVNRSEEIGLAGFHDEAPGQLEARTDDEGRVEVRDLWPLRVQPALSHVAHPRMTLDAVQLVAGETLDLGIVVLDDGARVSGVVRDRHGVPIAGARVVLGPTYWLGERSAAAAPLDLAFAHTLADHAQRPHALSGTAGSFEVALAASNTKGVALFVSAEGFEPVLSGPLDLASTPFEVTLLEEARLRVVARAADTGLVVEPSRVLAFRRTGTWGGSAPDSVPLPVEGGVVRHAGSLSTLLVIEAAGFTQALHEVAGVSPGEQRDLSVLLERARRLSVQVRDGNDVPVTDASVRVRPQGGAGLDGVLTAYDSPLSWRATVDDDGRVEFDGLAPREWRLDVSAAGFLDATVSVLLVPGQDLEHTVNLERSATLRGVILDAQGEPAVATPMMLWGERTGSDQLTNLHGRFEHTSLEPGEWLLLAELLPELRVTLVAGEVRELELVQISPAQIDVVVRLNGVPLEAQSVSLSGPSGGDVPGLVFKDARTDASGTAHFELDWAGDYRVSVDHPVAGVRDAAVQATLAETKRAELELTAGSGVLAGVVHAVGFGDTAPRLLLVLRHGAETRATQRATADQEFRFEHLPAGSYSLSSWSAEVADSNWGPFELAEGEVRENVEFDVVALARITIRAFHATGEPFQGSVHLRALDGSHAYESRGVSSGVLRNARLKPGTWQLDLATFSQRELGPDGRGEPGAELPFFAREIVTLEPGETRVLDLVVPGSPP